MTQTHSNAHWFSSETELWETPQEFFDTLNEEFHFTLDACATPENAKVPSYFSPEDDSLSPRCEWTGRVFCNSPYGRTIGLWMKKAFESSLTGALVVCLVPARTDTRWWHDYAMLGEIRFIKGRLKFGKAKSCAPFPSAVVIFRPSTVHSPQSIVHSPGDILKC